MLEVPLCFWKKICLPKVHKTARTPAKGVFLNLFKRSLGKAQNHKTLVLILILGLVFLLIPLPENNHQETQEGPNYYLALSEKKPEKKTLISQTVKAAQLSFSPQIPITGPETQSFSLYHKAIDIDTEWGQEVKPIAQGEVIKAGWDSHGKGKFVLVLHENNISSLYAHLSEIKVKEGEEIKAENIIGKSGQTGWSTGTHLHLEVYDDGKLVDPKNFLPVSE